MVVIATEIQLDQIVLEKLSCQLQCLLRRFGFEIANGVVGRGEKFGAVDVGFRLGNGGYGWRKSSCGSFRGVGAGFLRVRDGCVIGVVSAS